eukprot:COSAG05_NODE_80_length_21046_cov_45.708325_11_plen_237_part_00
MISLRIDLNIRCYRYYRYYRYRYCIVPVQYRYSTIQYSTRIDQVSHTCRISPVLQYRYHCTAAVVLPVARLLSCAQHGTIFNDNIEDYGIARTYRCTGQSYRYPFPQMGTDGKTSLGTDAVPVEHRYRYRKRHCSASRTLVQVQTYRISTVPVEYRRVATCDSRVSKAVAVAAWFARTSAGSAPTSAVAVGVPNSVSRSASGSGARSGLAPDTEARRRRGVRLGIQIWRSGSKDKE